MMRVAAWVVLTLAIGLAGCGRKGDPEPPKADDAVKTQDDTRYATAN